MEKVVIASLCVLIFVGGAGLLMGSLNDVTGNAIMDDYMYTRAFCEGNFCQDYEVSCDGGVLVEKKLVEGPWALHDEGWEDFREDGPLCE